MHAAGGVEGEAEKSESSTAPSNLEAHSAVFRRGVGVWGLADARKPKRHRVIRVWHYLKSTVEALNSYQ